MPDFTSALYLGFTHPSASLPSWGALTLGRPAALEEPTGGRTLTRELTQLIGGEAGILYPSTLHLFRDVFQVAAPKGTVILFDAASYAIARWAAEGAAVKGIPIETFPHRDVIALERRVRHAWASYSATLRDLEGQEYEDAEAQAWERLQRRLAELQRPFG